MKRYLSSALTLSLLVLSQTAMAKISPFAFKGVTKNLRKGKEMYSPTLGAVALDFLIADIRFNGNFQPGFDENGQRVYTKDTSKDPLWNVVKILFPSTNGVLGTDTTATTNFASYVKDPKTVADLINFAYKVRKLITSSYEQKVEDQEKAEEQPLQHIGEKRKLPEDFENRPQNKKLKPTNSKSKKRETEALNKKINDLKKSFTNSMKDKNKNIESNKITELLDNMTKAIQQEIKEGENCLYPKGTTEQILLAFFDYKFDTQDDIWHLLRAYDNEIVDQAAFSKNHPLNQNDEDLFTLESLQGILKKTDPYDMDDMFDLANADVFTALTPYKEGVALLNNGSAKVYERSTNTLTQNTFADCVETSLRHVLNLLFYDHEAKKFNVSKVVPPTGHPQENDPTHQLIQFFQKQRLEQASSGDIAYRSAFNTIVADLNVGSLQEGQSPIFYINIKKSQNEIETGALNFVNVLSRILNVPLKKSSSDLKDKNSKITWVESTLKEILDKSSEKKHTVEFQNVTQGVGEDLAGDLKIVAKTTQGRDLYSFRIKITHGHTEVKDLKQLSSKGQVIELEESIEKRYSSEKKSTEAALWLLMPKLTKSKIKELHPFYLLFSKALVDNQSRIDFMDTLVSLTEAQADFMKKNQTPLNNMLKNILKEVSWDDFEITRRISPSLLKLSKIETFKDTLSDAVQGFFVSEQKEIDELFKNFKNLNYLYIQKIEKIDFSGYEKELEGLSTIDIEGNLLKPSPLKSFTGLHHAKNLKTLDLSSAPHLKALNIEGPMEKLKGLSLHSNIESLTGLHHAKNLETLNLPPVSSLKALNIEGPMEKLKNLNLEKSNIESFTGVHHIKNLETLKINHTKRLKTLNIEGPMEKLKSLEVWFSEIEALTGLHHAKNLESLQLIFTKNLKELTIEGPMEKLKLLLAYPSGIGSFTGLHHAKNLECLDLAETPNLKALTIEEPMEKLSYVGLIASGIQKIFGGHNLPSDCLLALDQDQEITIFHKKGTAAPSLKLKSNLGKIKYEEEA